MSVKHAKDHWSHAHWNCGNIRGNLQPKPRFNAWAALVLGLLISAGLWGAAWIVWRGSL